MEHAKASSGVLSGSKAEGCTMELQHYDHEKVLPDDEEVFGARSVITTTSIPRFYRCIESVHQ